LRFFPYPQRAYLTLFDGSGVVYAMFETGRLDAGNDGAR
jgi:hypothetical protein